MLSEKKRSPWLWVPSLYYAQGIPNVMVMAVSLIMYKRLGVSNADIALYTSWLYLPWVIKPLWSPIVEIFGTKRFWIALMQILMGAGFACVGLSVPLPAFFKATLIFFWLTAFNSATHDIAADGFYILGLDTHRQVWFVGIRNTCFRLALLTGQGFLVMLAGFFEMKTGDVPFAWTITWMITALLFALFAFYHFFILPYPGNDAPMRNSQNLKAIGGEFVKVFASFFSKSGVIPALAFLLFYRFGESQLVKLAQLFMLDKRADGGLGLTTINVGFIYGTVGVMALMAGGLLGGFAAARHGLRRWIWWMAAAINLPDILYVYLSMTGSDSFYVISSCVAIEQFGYGFGFAAYMLFMVYFAEDSEYKAAHYAIMTGFMALGMMLPGMFSGWIQEKIGYVNFFIWVCIATIPGFISIKFLNIDSEFGKKKLETVDSVD